MKTGLSYLLPFLLYQLIWIYRGTYTLAIKDVIVEILEEPTDCTVRAQNGDMLSVNFNSTLEGEVFDRMTTTEFTLGDGGILSGWNKGLQGVCEGEKRRLYIPYHLAYDSQLFPPETNLTFNIHVTTIKKPIPDNPPMQWNLMDDFLTTVVMVTEEIEEYNENMGGKHNDSEGKKDKENELREDEDERTKKEGASKRGEKAVFYKLQFAVIPIAAILLLVVLYHVYRLEHPYKRTRFYKVSDHDHKPENGLIVQSFQ